MGLAPLAKISGLTLLAFTVGTLAWLSWRRRSWTILMATVGPMLLAAAALAGWWYLRNLRLYGDLLGFSRMHPGGTLREGFTWLSWLRTEAFGELKGVWLSSWGLFGWFTILLPAWVYAAITTLCAGALAALALWGRRLRDLDRGRLTWLALWGALVTASLLRWLSITKGGQGGCCSRPWRRGRCCWSQGWRRRWVAGARPSGLLGPISPISPMSPMEPMGLLGSIGQMGPIGRIGPMRPTRPTIGGWRWACMR